MTGHTKPLPKLIREIRTCFNQLRALAEQLASDLAINPSMRAVMESLSQGQPQSVPDLARNKGVSRQHIQKIANALLEQGLVRTETNPGHKRSVLYRLTPSGETLFADIRQRETAPMEHLSQALAPMDVAGATKVLSRMNHELKALINNGETR